MESIPVMGEDLLERGPMSSLLYEEHGRGSSGEGCDKMSLLANEER